MGSVNWKSFRPSSSCFILAGSPSAAAAAAAVRHHVCIVVSYVRCCGIRIHLSRLPTTAADLLAEGRPAVADDRIGSTSASHRVASLGRLCHDGSLLFLLLPPPSPSLLPSSYVRLLYCSVHHSMSCLYASSSAMLASKTNLKCLSAS